MEKFLERSIQKCPTGQLGSLMFGLNVLLPGVGTIFSGFYSERYNMNALIVGVSQLSLTIFFLLGWFWSIYWGWRIHAISQPSLKIEVGNESQQQ